MNGKRFVVVDQPDRDPVEFSLTEEDGRSEREEKKRRESAE